MQDSEEIKEVLNIYDSNHFNIDELRLISDLKLKYMQPDKIVFTRIKQVRKIMKYENMQKNKSKKLNKKMLKIF